MPQVKSADMRKPHTQDVAYFQNSRELIKGGIARPPNGLGLFIIYRTARMWHISDLEMMNNVINRCIGRIALSNRIRLVKR